MTLLINLTPDLESRLKTQAETLGVAPEEYAKHILEEHLPQPIAANEGNSLQQLFAEWAAEDATNDPEVIAQRERDWEELKDSINANHGSFRKPIR